MIQFLESKVDALEAFAIDVITDKPRGKFVAFLRFLLLLASQIFSFIAQARLFLYKNRILKSRSLGCLVVVVGNLTVGGTGKTPIVEKFARSLTSHGRKVAILSRGYKSKEDPLYKRFFRWITHGNSPPPKVVSDGQTVLLDSEIAGDEPYMLAQNLPGVVVIVDKNRVKAGRYAIEKFGVDTLVLDDGFQYLDLKGRMNLLLIDKTNPFGNGHLLPRGILREPIKHLKRASYVFITKSDGERDSSIEDTIRKHHPTVEIIECTHQPKYLNSINNGSHQFPLSNLKDANIIAFSGIARPESFDTFLTNLGANILHSERFVDHHRFTFQEMADLFRKAEELGADMIVTTEKDAVRIPKVMRSPVPLNYLRLEIEILQGAQDFEKAVSEICFPQTPIQATRPIHAP